MCFGVFLVSGFYINLLKLLSIHLKTNFVAILFGFHFDLEGKNQINLEVKEGDR